MVFCEYFTWYKDSGGCWLLGNIAELRPNPEAVAGPKRCEVSTPAPAADVISAAPTLQPAGPVVMDAGEGSRTGSTGNMTGGSPGCALRVCRARETRNMFCWFSWFLFSSFIYLCLSFFVCLLCFLAFPKFMLYQNSASLSLCDFVGYVVQHLDTHCICSSKTLKRLTLK
ncbi:unnamed protein product [Polarella glacialis]|uniref:Uncharacterized protein n=1 Tax=Polarella glacialis TaxID=89957 RepID=A0A813GX30_POLGL|nr:unnamed protein product [Polarella glacialis]CAE8640528.1 unnamed protein product [Polarella glacialis]